MLLLIHCLFCCLRFFVFGSCVVQYLVAFLVLKSSRWGRERESRAGCLKIAF